MGELLLCKEAPVTVGYLFPDTGISVYSLEELCYYINENIFLIEKDFMSDELCNWISHTVRREALGDTLREIMTESENLSAFVDCLLKDVGYCTLEERQHNLNVLKEMENKSEFQCAKIRADRHMEHRRYMAGLLEYRRLLEREDASSENPLIIADIWHNLGVAYCKMFLFREGAEAFEKAYEIGRNKASRRQCLFAYRCLGDQVGFDRICEKYHMNEMEILEIRNELTMASRNEEIVAFEQRLETMARKEYRTRTEAMEEINFIVDDWKDDYCKMTSL